MNKKSVIYLIIILLFIETGCSESNNLFLPSTESCETMETFPSTATNVINITSEKNEKEISFKAYKIEQDIYYQFIKNPQKSILDKQDNGTEVYVISRSIIYPGKFSLEKLNSTAVELYDDENEYIAWEYLNGLILYDSFMDFIGNTTKMEIYLKENGIIGNVKNIALVETLQSPSTIWVVVDQENYFITINEKSDDSNNVDEKTYFYRIYNHSDYYEKFRMKDTKLIVKDKDISDGNYVKTNGVYVYVSLNAIIEQLGGKVELYDNKSGVFITYNNKKYIFDMYDEIDPKDIESDYIFIYNGVSGGYTFFEIIDGEVIVDSSVLRAAIQFNMDLKVRLDYDDKSEDKLIIYIE